MAFLSYTINCVLEKIVFVVVFNRKVSWKKNVHIGAWVSFLSHNQGLVKVVSDAVYQRIFDIEDIA